MAATLKLAGEEIPLSRKKLRTPYRKYFKYSLLCIELESIHAQLKEIKEP